MNMIRSALTAALVAAVFVVPGAASANASHPPCSWTVTGIPTNYRIGIDRPSATVSGPCTTADQWHLTADVHHRDGTMGAVAGTTMKFEGCPATPSWMRDGKCVDGSNPAQQNDFPPISKIRLNIWTVGQFATHPSPDSWAVLYPLSDSHNWTPVFTAETFTAKLGTTTKLTITRSGTTRTLTITPKHYSVSARAMIASVNQPVEIQRFLSGTWRHYRTLKSSHRTITYSTHTSTTFKWRAQTAATSSRWGSTSTTVTR